MLTLFEGTSDAFLLFRPARLKLDLKVLFQPIKVTPNSQNEERKEKEDNKNKRADDDHFPVPI